MTSSDYDPTSEGAETDFARRMSYGDYLGLDAILSAQHPLSEAHDEMLFIIQHQTTELWMRLAIHELSAARRAIGKDEVQPAMKMLARMSRIFEQLNNAWDVLRTMTPSEYTRFRSQLGQSSGFQSRQYRLIEFLLGNRNHAMLKPHAHDAETTKLLEAEPRDAQPLRRGAQACRPQRADDAGGGIGARRPRDPQLQRGRAAGLAYRLRGAGNALDAVRGSPRSLSISKIISGAGGSTT